MPSTPLTEERREELRRQEWEDREYYDQRLRESREHELVLTKMKLVEAGKIKLETVKATDKRNRIVVRCIALLSLFGRPVPPVLAKLLDK